MNGIILFTLIVGGGCLILFFGIHLLDKWRLKKMNEQIIVMQLGALRHHMEQTNKF